MISGHFGWARDWRGWPLWPVRFYGYERGWVRRELQGGGSVRPCDWDGSEPLKILLVQPKKPEKTFGGDDFAMFEPLALGYLAAAVKDEHEVRIVDLRIEDVLDETLEEFRPDVVGVTAYTVHVNVVNRMCEKIKGLGRGITTVVGGHHATVHHEDFVTPHIDLIVTGEGSIPFRAAMERVAQGRSFEDIPGCIYKQDGELVIQEAVSYDLDTVPMPDRSFTKRYRNHYASEWMRPMASVRTSKGCPFSCSYCALWTLTGRKYLVRDPEKIVEELKSVEEPCVFFADDESFIQVDRMMELADAIEASGVKKRYYLYVRADTTVRHPELLQRWKDVGLERVFVGLEFFKDEDLDAVNKAGSADKNNGAIKIIQDLGIDLFPAFIIRPDFDKEDFVDLAKYCRDHNFDFVGFSVLTPLPGTELHRELADQMILKNYDYYDFVHTLLPTKLPYKEFYKQYRRLFDTSRTFRAKFAFLWKYRWREIPRLFALAWRFNLHFARLYRDYDDLDAVNAEQVRYGGMPTRRPLMQLRLAKEGEEKRRLPTAVASSESSSVEGWGR